MNLTQAKEALPHIFMGLGMAFGVTATVEGIRSTFEFVEEGYDRNYIRDKSIPAKEKAKTVGKYYWKAGVPLGLAFGCFVSAQRGYSAQIADAMSIAMWWKQHDMEYRKKNRELYGEENDKAVEDAIIRDHISKNPPPAKKQSDAYLIYDPITDQYFEATQKELDHAEREMNRILGKESPVDYRFFLKHFRHADYDKPICRDIGWFLDDTYADYHYWNESFYARQLFEIYLDEPDYATTDYYILSCSIEPMLNVELDSDVVKDSQDLQRI